MKDEKYLVIKRSEWDELMSQPTDSDHSDCVGYRTVESLALEDAVVIRRQDVFAPPALDAYANTIMASCEMMAAMLPRNAEEATSDLAIQIRELRDISDYFHSQAQEAWLEARKIPD